MQKLTCIIVDDETIARKAIKEYVAKVEELELIHLFKNGMEAKAWLQAYEVDLIFLDINMPFLNGLELLRVMKKHPAVIFTTAYPEHALESFEFHVIDYLVKPIAFDRFLQAVNKALRIIGSTTTGGTQHLILKEGNSIVKILISDIEYIEAMQNYIRIHCTDRNYTILMTMKEILSQLPATEFFQTHRSYIVQRGKIKKIDVESLQLTEAEISISKRSRSAFLEWFGKA